MMENSEIKNLWEYDNYTLFEIEVFHHCPEYYKSWEDFINDARVFSCNCIYGNPLLYWYWDNNWTEEDGTDEIEQFEFSKTKENFKRIILIYRCWFSSMCKINILVTLQDEPNIRKFISEAQQPVFIVLNK